MIIILASRFVFRNDEFMMITMRTTETKAAKTKRNI